MTRELSIIEYVKKTITTLNFNKENVNFFIHYVTKYQNNRIDKSDL